MAGGVNAPKRFIPKIERPEKGPYLEPDTESLDWDPSRKAYSFNIMSEEGEKLGYIAARMGTFRDKDQLHIDNIEVDKGPQTLGFQAIKNLKSQLKQHFPDATSTGGFRVSGMRTFGREGEAEDKAGYNRLPLSILAGLGMGAGTAGALWPGDAEAMAAQGKKVMESTPQERFQRLLAGKDPKGIDVPEGIPKFENISTPPTILESLSHWMQQHGVNESFTQNLTGSSGLPGSQPTGPLPGGMGLLNLTPLGTVSGVQEGLRNKDPQAALVNLVGGGEAPSMFLGAPSLKKFAGATEADIARLTQAAKTGEHPGITLEPHTGKLLYEIPDKGTTIEPVGMGEGWNVQHPILNLQDMYGTGPVKPMPLTAPSGTLARFDPVSKEVFANPREFYSKDFKNFDEEQMIAAILHEYQHAEQHASGLPSGFSPGAAAYTPTFWNRLGKPMPQELKGLNEMADNIDAGHPKYWPIAKGVYDQSAGENVANETQMRYLTNSYDQPPTWELKRQLGEPVKWIDPRTEATMTIDALTGGAASKAKSQGSYQDMLAQFLQANPYGQ